MPTYQLTMPSKFSGQASGSNTMNFAEVLTKEFLTTWEGRINRQRFWAYFLVYVAAFIVVSLVESVIGLSGILSTLFILAALFPSI